MHIPINRSTGVPWADVSCRYSVWVPSRWPRWGCNAGRAFQSSLLSRDLSDGLQGRGAPASNPGRREGRDPPPSECFPTRPGRVLASGARGGARGADVDSNPTLHTH